MLETILLVLLVAFAIGSGMRVLAARYLQLNNDFDTYYSLFFP